MKEESLTDLGEGLSELLLLFWGHGRGGGHVGAEPSLKESEPGGDAGAEPGTEAEKEPGSEAVSKQAVQTAQFSLILPVSA